jgi:membrane-associated protease RseP (regulator of RpoE activity)
MPALPFGSTDEVLFTRQMLMSRWQEGLIYTACILAILITHEMGHFLATVIYRVPASLPFVIPLPISPLGTLGAVIGMESRRADRKQTFDIGLAGPLAGLVVAIPILIWGVYKLDLTQERFGQFELHSPLLIEWLMRLIQPPGYEPHARVALSQLNPYFMAGWAGMLVTGLNMLPVSQLDGGHVIYTVFGRNARWAARAFIVAAIGWCMFSRTVSWTPMLLLIMLVGVDHPPTRDDTVPLGWPRIVLGIASLAIPVLCFAPVPISPPM